MVALPGAGGVMASTRLPNPPSFAPQSGHYQGNDLPGQTGSSFDAYHMQPGPGPGSGGQAGVNDGAWGADPTRGKVQPCPHVSVWGEGDDTAVGEVGLRRQSFWRGGIQGFNDKLTTKDRHVYWDSGHQRSGVTFVAAAANPNTYNNPMQEPPQPELRALNRTISYQKGTDVTRNADDLSRPYTWLGEQGSGWAPVYGGVPGLYQPYGTRSGVPYPIVAPVAHDSPGDGPQKVWSGPPHGLHSLTYPDRGDTLNRYAVNPQMRPVRVDRPSNSPQAGQSYSQTVQTQGGPPPTGATTKAQPWTARLSGRGWLGTGQ
jgi:hypothetical protein